MDNTMDTLRSKLGAARGIARSRIWIEGKRLTAVGFTVGSHFNAVLDISDPVIPVMTLHLDNRSGERKVSGKGDKPIIDITGAWVRDHFGSFFSTVDVTYEPGKITIRGAS